MKKTLTFSPLMVLDDKTKDALTSEYNCKYCRVINPGEMYTLDYVDSRLNIEIDNKSRVRRVWVG